jgi:hypothetical protein
VCATSVAVRLGTIGPTLADTVPGLVSVLVPHFDDFGSLKRCLEHLLRQDWPAERLEVIIADNNSPGGVAAVAAIAPAARVVAAAEQGAGPARNAAAAASRGEVLVFLDCDCLPDRDWLREGVAALGCYDVVGGQVIVSLGDPARLTPSAAYEAVFAYDIERYVRRNDYAGSGNLFVPRAVFDRVGGFRVGIPEDIDWCWRAAAAGYRVGYAEGAIVRTAARCDWAALKRKHDRMEREHLTLFSEYPGWRWRWLLHAALVALSPFGHWVRVVGSNRLTGPRTKMLALCGLFLLRSYRAWRMLWLLAGAAQSGPPRDGRGTSLNFRLAARKWRAAVREGGLAAACRSGLALLRPGRHRDAWDLGHGAETAGDEPLWLLDIASANAPFGVRYQALDEGNLTEAVDFLRIPDLRRFTFVDLGCGKGRALLVAAKLGFGRIIGVEFASQLVATAKRNLLSAGIKNAIVLHQDAADFEPPDDELVIFLYNPFSREVVRPVLENLGRRATNSAQMFYVIYQRPVCAEFFDAADFLVPIDSPPGCRDTRLWVRS